ncbi:hypothetical protein RhiirA5_414963 [Rhizophagus irregularis]|uniref:Uncharacterized protein n=1 Tax=Rhizophagus irregularis TaxID=588596 RepID=A0A2I1F4T1_9GLOM|nr:hypothetical protein RhiirA5_414963 [Rhizophagus irregularis]PKC71299.1 hypothetical protein RhiirA1_453698 [Rhizophagus irregularis]PKY29384.1 hypothetical protein RhiirB3_445991 [Rhizophagus irregularis]
MIKNNLTNSLDIWKVDIPGDTANIKLKPLENRSHDINNEKIIIKEIGAEDKEVLVERFRIILRTSPRSRAFSQEIQGLQEEIEVRDNKWTFHLD